MDKFELSSRVRVAGTTLVGSVADITDSGLLVVQLDIGGSLQIEAGKVELADADGFRKPDGTFAPGHPGFGPNPDNDADRASARKIRQTMLNELQPFFSHVGTYVGQIGKPEKKIDALAKLAPYILPALSRIEFTDETPRNLTVEQALAERLAKLPGK